MQTFALRAATVVAALGVCACSGWTQPKLINLNVVALDKSGQPVSDLTAADFQVLDDGKPQSIALFRLNNNSRPADIALAPHEYSNRAKDTPQGATILIFDLLNGTFTDRNYIAGTIVKALGQVEKPANVFLYFITNKGEFYPIHPLPNGDPKTARLDENWTTQSKAMIDAAIQNVYGLRPMDDRDIGVRAVTAYTLLHDLGAAASAFPGRKAVVWITDGVPLNVNYGGLCRDIPVLSVVARCTGQFVDFTPVVRNVGGELDRDGVTIYPVEAYGITAVTREVLQDLANITGGKVFASGGTVQAVADAVQAMRMNYSIAYEPASWDGRFHKLRVSCKRKGVQVLAEQGYTAVAPVEDTAKLIQTAAFNAEDIAAIGLRATVSASPKPGAIRVHVRIDPSSICVTDQNGRFTGQLALIFLALTDKGPATLSRPNALSLNLTQAQYETALRDGVTLSDDLMPPAAVNRIRLVVVDRSTNRVGSLTIPEGGSGKL